MALNRLSGNSWWQATCNNCMDCQDKNDPRKQQALAAALATVRTAERRFDNRRPGAQQGGCAKRRMSCWWRSANQQEGG